MYHPQPASSGFQLHLLPLTRERARTAMPRVPTHGPCARWQGDREEPALEPYVSFLPWDDATQTLRAPVPLVMGFQSDAGERWGRAVDPVPGPDGSLYLTDDAAGLVYRITPGGGE